MPEGNQTAAPRGSESEALSLKLGSGFFSVLGVSSSLSSGLLGSVLGGGGGLRFGWAKPVPVNFGALRNPKRDMIWVALAGPGCNLLQAVIWGIILKLLVIAGVQEQFFLQMAVYGISINIFLMAFNLIPIPPLDGGRVAVGILPWSVGKYLDRIEPYGMWIVLALCLVGGAGFFTGPLVAFGRAVVNFFIGL